MAKTKISQYDSTANNNTDINNIDIAEGCAPSGINNAIREMMAQLKNFQTGAGGDGFAATQIDLLAQSALRFQDTTGGEYVAFRAPGTVASSITWTLPSADGTANQFLKTNGSGLLSWDTVAQIYPSAGVAVSTGSSWGASLTAPSSDLVGISDTQTLTNKTINGANNTITGVSLSTGITGTLPVANGGTGATTSTGALNALLPAQSAQTGKYLSTDGTNATWEELTAPSSLPVGTLQYFAFPTTTTYPGEEWLPCDGSIVTQTAYSNLFDKLGLILDGGSDWSTQTATGLGGSYNAVTFGNDLYVLAGTGGRLATSTDGATWGIQSSGTTSGIQALTYGNGLFVYAGIGGVLATSTDAVTWTARTSGTTSAITALTYGDGLFVYGGVGGVLRTSTDGITWDARTSGTTSTINALVYGDGLFVYAGNNSTNATSTNAITWTLGTLGISTSNGLSLLYADGTYIVGTNSTGARIRTSTDGATWQTVAGSGSAAPSIVNGLAYNNGAYVAVGGNGVIARSYDLTEWFASTTGTTITFNSVVYGKDFVAVGNSSLIQTSPLYNYNAAVEFKLPISANIENINQSDFGNLPEENLYIKVE